MTRAANHHPSNPWNQSLTTTHRCSPSSIENTPALLASETHLVEPSRVWFSGTYVFGTVSAEQKSVRLVKRRPHVWSQEMADVELPCLLR
jgi:hypothetical protein